MFYVSTYLSVLSWFSVPKMGGKITSTKCSSEHVLALDRKKTLPSPGPGEGAPGIMDKSVVFLQLLRMKALRGQRQSFLASKAGVQTNTSPQTYRHYTQKPPDICNQ